MTFKSLISYANLLFILFVSAYHAVGQVIIPGDYAREYYDLLLFKDTSLNSPINQFPSIVRQYHKDSEASWNIWGDHFKTSDPADQRSFFSIVDPILRYNYITQTPRGYNDGAQWNGKGSNIFLSGGFVGQLGILNFAFVPNFLINENKPFGIPSNPWGDRSQYSYPFNRNIDWVQRFGNSTHTQFDWGQSEVRLIYKNFTVGLSTENFRWGVTQFAPILMSYNAAGFPHLDLGTNVPVATKIGRFEARAFWGRIGESDYFDNDPVKESGYITGLSVGYQPSFFPQFKIGLNRVMNTIWSDGDLKGRDFFVTFLNNQGNGFEFNDFYDQMASVFFDFSFPEVGFRTYIEFARNDFPGAIGEFYSVPDRSGAHTLGLMKTFKIKGDRVLKLLFESTTLSVNQLKVFPAGTPTYYVHPYSKRGYTHQGQIIGAGIGPGSNSNLIQAELYQQTGKFGINLTRIRFNDDYYTAAYGNKGIGSPTPYDVEIAIGIDYVRFLEKWTINPNITWNFRRNWYYQDEIHLNNFFLGLNFSTRF
ncbi:MAG: capsule assembly Wzi family protein [Bacteroidota bacterium]